jgi:hypothetical protein
MKKKDKPAHSATNEPIDSYVGLIMAALGGACLAHAGAWVVIRQPEATTDSFVGAEGMAVWSVVFIVLGLTLWASDRQK